jgi:chitin-binding protein
MFPGSRTFLCWQDGLRENGQIIPYNPACANAVAQTGTTPLYNWFAVLRSDGAGRTAGFIPDGQICSGGTGGPYDFTAYNAARSDWPLTHLTSGSTIQIRHSNWAAHPGSFVVYITPQGWSPTTPLRWADLTSIGGAENPPASGGPGALNYYWWNQQLPSNRSGRALLFVHWIRSDSQENFYSCSDIVFDGGNGEVTGVGPGGTQPPPTTPPPPTSPPPTSPPPTSPPPTTNPPPPPGDCAATYRTVNAWPDGFQGEITVSAGSSPVNGWRVQWTNPSGQTITQLWSGLHTSAGSLSTVTNASWNGAIPANGSTMFGFLGSGNSPGVQNLTCASP